MESSYIKDFTFQDLGNGLIVVDPTWKKNNIESVILPCIGVVWTNKIIIPNLLKIFQKIKKEKLGEFVTLERGGCVFCPRKKFFDRKKEVSPHAFGLAIDLNVYYNPIGKMPNFPLSFNKDNINTLKIISIFEENDFIWGGNFSFLESSHFQFKDF